MPPSPKERLTHNDNLFQGCVSEKAVETIPVPLHELDISKINYALLTGLFWSSHKIIISPGDGHCLLYSIITSNNFRASRRKHYGLSYVIESLRNETVTNADIYVQFRLDCSRSTLLSEMKSYIYHKTYETSYCDCVPLVIANALGINIVIVNKIATGYETKVIIGRSNSHCDKTVLYLYKTGEHYDAIVPRSGACHNEASCGKLLVESESNSCNDSYYGTVLECDVESSEKLLVNEYSRHAPVITQGYCNSSGNATNLTVK